MTFKAKLKAKLLAATALPFILAANAFAQMPVFKIMTGSAETTQTIATSRISNNGEMVYIYNDLHSGYMKNDGSLHYSNDYLYNANSNGDIVGMRSNNYPTTAFIQHADGTQTDIVNPLFNNIVSPNLADDGTLYTSSYDNASEAYTIQIGTKGSTGAYTFTTATRPDGTVYNGLIIKSGGDKPVIEDTDGRHYSIVDAENHIKQVPVNPAWTEFAIHYSSGNLVSGFSMDSNVSNLQAAWMDVTSGETGTVSTPGFNGSSFTALNEKGGILALTKDSFGSISYDWFDRASGTYQPLDGLLTASDNHYKILNVYDMSTNGKYISALIQDTTNGNINLARMEAVPEPTSMMGMALGAGVLAFGAKRRRAKHVPMTVASASRNTTPSTQPAVDSHTP